MRRFVAGAAVALGLAASGNTAAAPLFTPNDPLAAKQWYLAQDHAFDAWPDAPPATLGRVRVAVIDSGIDGGHAEFLGRIATQRSFVDSSPLTDTNGHGTFVAGEIAAATNNGQGIAGIAFPAQLVIAKVVGADGTIALGAEARAIRWAVSQGARVINLSLGGLRDPHDPRQDTYSPVEARAVDFAVRHGAVVVAAVGNGDEAPKSPWPFASYPAALPHVIGVSAYARNGSVPDFSNRDAIYNDLAAPGEDIVSTLPRSLSTRAGCVDVGYSDCGPDDYKHAEGTSFAAPQVSAAAALLLAVNPALTSDQVTTILERSADDANPANGCRRCLFSRDSLTGWGRLDVAKALAAATQPPPTADRYETNDDAGTSAATLWGRTLKIHATLDFWDDQIDVYRVHLAARDRLDARVQGPKATNTDLVLWKPGTTHVEGLSLSVLKQRAAIAAGHGAAERIVYRAPRAGWYYVEVKLAGAGSGPYSLTLVKRQ